MWTLTIFSPYRPELKPVEKEIEVTLKFPEVEALNPPVLTLNEIQFKYSQDKVIFTSVNLCANLDSRICIVRILASGLIRNGVEEVISNFVFFLHE